MSLIVVYMIIPLSLCRNCSLKVWASYETAQKKIVNLVTSATNSTVIDYASAFTKVKDTCKDVLAATKQVHDVAAIQLKEIAHLPRKVICRKRTRHTC